MKALLLVAGILVLLLWVKSPTQGADFFSPESTTWKLLRGRQEASAPMSAWREVTFDDSTWETAPAPIYYSTAATEPPFFRGGVFTGTRLDGMQNTYTCVFLRKEFNVGSITNVEELTLAAACDDGFVAWINGREVTRYNVPEGDLGFDATAFDAPTEPVPFQTFSLSNPAKFLREGRNVLAIQAFNRAADSTDFGLMAGLSFTAPLPPLPDTKFDHDRGYYSAPFLLDIACADPGATIYYTLDGSSPSSTHGQVFTAPIAIQATTVVRARAERSGFKPSNIDTHSYLFVNDIPDQSPNGAAPPGWPTRWGDNKVDYGMDPEIVDQPPWKEQIIPALQSLPAFSLVTDAENLFDADEGIYANADGAGRAWERPCSLELLPRDDAGGFQENCGVRIRGGFSRSRDDPKHSFRFYFRSDYGVSVLRYPLFGSAAGTSIDQFDLRTAQDGSWAYTGTRDGHFINDPFVRDTLLALGQPSERGNFVHLYINGQYWGLYNTCERPEASYAANYFGGEKEDYDVLKPDPQSGYVMTVTDGNDLAWTQLWRAATNGLADDAAYFAVQGRAPDGRIDPAGTNLLEVVNLIDYLLTIIWTGDYDGPIYGDLNDGFLNNYYAFRSRRNPGGFRFVTHDAELSLGDVNENRTGTSTRGDPGRGDGPDRLNPYYLWTRLSPNREFRTLVADRIQKHFFNGGALSTAACLARFQARRDEIAGAVVAESARWGDAQHPNDPITAAEWNEAVQDKLANYLPRRSAIVLRQLQARGFWPPAVGAPTLSAAGGEAGAGRTLALTQTNSGGQILFTLDGSDPRSPGGAISPGALTYQGAIPVEGRLTVRARVKSGLAWSPLVEASFATAQDLHALRVTELMFHPPALGDVDGDEFEFIELKNAGATAFDLSGMRFASGIEFTFANGTFAAAGQFIVLARNEAHFRAKYPGIALHGVYSGHLANSGEVVTLSSADGASFLSFSYGDGPPWPRAADGEGYSLVPLEPTEPGEPNDPHSWRASARAGGSPGADDVPRSLPELHLSRDGGRVLLSWRRASADLVLETSDALGLEPIWQRLPFDEVGNAEQVRVTVELSPTAAFFRLRQSQP